MALALEPEELLEALLLEGRVADGEHLVDQQDLGFDLDRGGEREPHEHPRGVVLQPQVHEVLELGESHHVVESRKRLSAAEPEHDRVDDHVVARVQVDVETDTQLDERRQAPGDGYAAAVDAVDAGDALEQRALATAVAPDDPEEFALGDLEVYVLDSVQFVVGGAPQRMQRALLERRVLLVGQSEGLADALDRDGCMRPSADRRRRARSSWNRGRQGPMNASNGAGRAAQTRCRMYTSWLSWLRPGANSRTLPARAKLREHPLRARRTRFPSRGRRRPSRPPPRTPPRTTSRDCRGRLAISRDCSGVRSSSIA